MTTARPFLRNLGRKEDRAEIEACEAASPHGPRADHDYRREDDPTGRTYLVCVWCRAVSCGNADQADPCIEPWHHEPRPHRAANGTKWPIGGSRPGVEG